MLTPRPVFVVNRPAAHQRKTGHQFVPGLGYVAHQGPPPLNPRANGTKNCDPPQGTRDGSVHLLRPPNGHPPITMVWIAMERAWASRMPERGNRLAWPTSHLRRAEWEYIGPAR